MPAFSPHDYQGVAHEFLLRRLFQEGHKGGGLFMDPGLGKTVTTLWTLDTLRQLGEVRRTLIVAPLRVCYSVWPAEVDLWGWDFDVSIIHGSPKKRREALARDADLYVINPEGLKWLKEHLRHDIDTLVVDESTKFKNFSTKTRMAPMKKMLPQFDRRIILTGTPSPNSYADLFSQIYLLDDGATLGKTLGYFRSRYMSRGGFKGRVWQFDGGMSESLEEAIKPLVLRLDACDHLDMPELVVRDVWVDLPPDVMRAYKKFERELFLSLADDESLIASSAGAAYASCRGIANGGIYLPDNAGNRGPRFVHDAKVEALVDLVDELAGKSVLVAYQFQHDADRILRKFPRAPIIRGGQKPAETDAIIDRWNRGEIQVLLAQPQAMSHGLNMQKGGCDIAWFGLTDSLETYQQFNARIYRQGQTGRQVRLHRFLTRGTVEEAIAERQTIKSDNQKALMDSLNAYKRRADVDYALAV